MPNLRWAARLERPRGVALSGRLALHEGCFLTENRVDALALIVLSQPAHGGVALFQQGFDGFKPTAGFQSLGPVLQVLELVADPLASSYDPAVLPVMQLGIQALQCCLLIIGIGQVGELRQVQCAVVCRVVAAPIEKLKQP